MLKIICYLLIITSYTSSGLQCPLWTRPLNGSCKCGSDIEGIVRCDDQRGVTEVAECFCITTHENYSSPIVGRCFYQCNNNKLHRHLDTKRINDTCIHYNRTGVMCGECVEGYALPVYSYSLSCVECSHYKYNWIKYTALAYGPLTLFYILVILFRISATSGYMVGYVAICQILTPTGLVAWIQNTAAYNKEAFVLYKCYIAFISIWNLDFFRSLYPPFCLHLNLSALQVLSLDYIVAVYPMLLVALTYLIVKSHDHFPVIVWLCRPAYTCFRHFRKEWDIKTSLVGAFATFYLLSYVKILNVSIAILVPTYLYDMDGNVEGKPYFFYDASVPYFGKEHHSYALLAIFLTLIFNILPLLLLSLYPCPHFQHGLNKIRCCCHVLHTFMDALLGSYTHKPRERRYFGAFYLLIRIIHLLAFGSFNPFTYLSAVSYTLIFIIVLLIVSRPYKKNVNNITDIILFLIVLHSSLFVLFKMAGRNIDPVDMKRIGIVEKINYLIYSLIPLYGTAMCMYIFLPWKPVFSLFSEIAHSIWNRELKESLPYRLQSSEKQALLQKGT